MILPKDGHFLILEKEENVRHNPFKEVIDQNIEFVRKILSELYTFL
jgi:hypothetical protein